jgi:hypothetical protein
LDSGLRATARLVSGYLALCRNAGMSRVVYTNRELMFVHSWLKGEDKTPGLVLVEGFTEQDPNPLFTDFQY